MKVLALDYGSARTGVAVSDPTGTVARPLEVVENASAPTGLKHLADLAEREGVERIVVGLPLNMDDSVGPGAKQAMQWGNDVARRAAKPIVYVDERLSSFDAEQSLNERKRGGEKLTRKRRKEQLDALAAAGFLQAFLDGKLTALDV